MNTLPWFTPLPVGVPEKIFWPANVFAPVVANALGSIPPSIVALTLLSPAPLPVNEFAVMLPVNVLLPAPSCGTTAGFIPSVTPPVVPPPVSPAPAVTPVIVPPPTPVAALLITLPSGNVSALPAPLIFTFPATSSFCVGTPVPIPKFPPLDITNDLLATAAPFSYRKNPNVSSTNADCCNSQKLFGRFVSSNRITGAELRMCSFRCGVPVPIPRFPALLTTNDLSATAAPFSYRKNPNVSNTNADCCNSQKLFGKFVSSNRIVGAPLFRCSVLAGLLVPIPTFAPVASNLATKFCVPPPPIVAAPMAPVLGNTVPTPPPLPVAGLASTNDDTDLPPNVSASEAFSAYGTLTSSTRGCSTSFGRFACTPNHRGSPAVNSSSGNPSLLVDPNRTV